MVRFQKEEEEKTLKALTLFCFPEGVNWAPLTEYPRYCNHMYIYISFLPACPVEAETVLFMVSLFLYFTVKHSLSCLQMLMDRGRMDTVGGYW